MILPPPRPWWWYGALTAVTFTLVVWALGGKW